MRITNIKALWPENTDFIMERKNTGNQYIFIHFLTPSKVWVDGEIISVSEGSCILYDKFSYQLMYPDNCEFMHDWFHAVGNMDLLVKKYGLVYNKIYTVQKSSKITKIIQTIENEYYTDNKYSGNLIELKIEELIINIVRSINEAEKNLFINPELRKAFFELRNSINLTYYEDWNVEKMASKVNLSVSVFYKIYKEIFGISPKKYLQNIRIEHAKSLIIQNKYLIKDIAEMTGYKNQYHFIRQFKEYTGTTPGKYAELEELI